MEALDRDALLCDMAETYGIYDLRALPADTLAVLACGLSADSRIKRKAAGLAVPTDTMLLSAIADRLGLLVWSRTKNGQRGIGRPTSILAILTGADKKDKVETFDTPEEFRAAYEAARAKILEEGKHNGD